MKKKLFSKLMMTAAMLFIFSFTTKLSAQDFTGQFDPSLANPWPDAGHGGTYLGSFTGNSSYFVEGTDLDSNAGTTYFQGVWWDVTASGTVTFDWSYNTNDDWAEYDPAGYLLDITGDFEWFNSQHDSAYGVHQLTDDDGSWLETQSGTVTVNVTAGGTFGFYVYTTDGSFGAGELTISNFSFTADDDGEPGETCGWRIRVWGNNGMDVEWTLTDGNGNEVDVSPEGGWATSNISYLSDTYNLVEPVTFNLKANTSGNYQSVNYYLLRNGGKIEHGRVRDSEVTFVRNCSDDVGAAKPGMNSSLTAFDFSYHPNPVKDVLFINSALDVKEVKVFNIAGQQLLNLNKDLGAQSEINVSSLPEGVYVIRAVLEDGKVETFKVVKR